MAGAALWRRHPGARVVYLDPDIEVVRPLAPVADALAEAELALTPHVTAPLEDGRAPDDLSMSRCGAYNLGFIGVREAPAARRFVEWWHRRLRRSCRWQVADRLFYGQKWVDRACRPPGALRFPYLCGNSHRQYGGHDRARFLGGGHDRARFLETAAAFPPPARPRS